MESRDRITRNRESSHIEKRAPKIPSLPRDGDTCSEWSRVEPTLNNQPDSQWILDELLRWDLTHSLRERNDSIFAYPIGLFTGSWERNRGPFPQQVVMRNPFTWVHSTDPERRATAGQIEAEIGQIETAVDCSDPTWRGSSSENRESDGTRDLSHAFSVDDWSNLAHSQILEPPPIEISLGSAQLQVSYDPSDHHPDFADFMDFVFKAHIAPSPGNQNSNEPRFVPAGDIQVSVSRVHSNDYRDDVVLGLAELLQKCPSFIKTLYGGTDATLIFSLGLDREGEGAWISDFSAGTSFPSESGSSSESALTLWLSIDLQSASSTGTLAQSHRLLLAILPGENDSRATADPVRSIDHAGINRARSIRLLLLVLRSHDSSYVLESENGLKWITGWVVSVVPHVKGDSGEAGEAVDVPSHGFLSGVPPMGNSLNLSLPSYFGITRREVSFDIKRRIADRLEAVITVTPLMRRRSDFFDEGPLVNAVSFRMHQMCALQPYGRTIWAGGRCVKGVSWMQYLERYSVRTGTVTLKSLLSGESIVVDMKDGEDVKDGGVSRDADDAQAGEEPKYRKKNNPVSLGSPYASTMVVVSLRYQAGAQQITEQELSRAVVEVRSLLGTDEGFVGVALVFHCFGLGRENLELDRGRHGLAVLVAV